MRSRPRQVSTSGWPPLPANGVFPELLTTVEVAQLLRDDADGMSVERARRNVQWLTRNRKLPVLSKLGQKYLYRKADVLTWLVGRGRDGRLPDTTEAPDQPAPDVGQLA